MAEVRLIDANALPVQELWTSESIFEPIGLYMVVHKAALDAAPTIEAEPVRHGRWIPTEYDSYAGGAPVWDKWECSECGHEHIGEEDTLTSFCPDCGAKMNGGVPTTNTAHTAAEKSLRGEQKVESKTEQNSIYGELSHEIVRNALKTGLPAWKIRLLLEYRQLRARLDKLKKVILKTNDASKDIAQRLTDTERMLMLRQESAMQMYLDCLKKRAALHGFDNLLEEK